MSLTVIGDVHGKVERYLDIAPLHEHTVQVGDFGFGDHYRQLNHSGLDPVKHKIVRGNHDDYTQPSKHVYPADYGYTTLGGVSFFFIRGAYSDDKMYRTPWRDWWPDEEITQQNAIKVIEEFGRIKPKIVISHDCPEFMMNMYTSYPTSKPFTRALLEECYHIHQPELWIFGHHHVTRSIVYDETVFQCVGELDTFEIPHGYEIGNRTEMASEGDANHPKLS